MTFKPGDKVIFHYHYKGQEVEAVGKVVAHSVRLQKVAPNFCAEMVAISCTPPPAFAKNGQPIYRKIDELKRAEG